MVMMNACAQSSILCSALPAALQSDISAEQSVSESEAPNACSDAAITDASCSVGGGEPEVIECFAIENISLLTEEGTLPIRVAILHEGGGSLFSREPMRLRHRPSYESPHWISEQIAARDNSFVPEPLASPDDYDSSRTFRMSLEARIMSRARQFGGAMIFERPVVPPVGSIHILHGELQHVPGIREHFLDADGNLSDTAVDYRRRAAKSLEEVAERDPKYMMLLLDNQAPFWDMFLTTEKARIVELVKAGMEEQRKHCLFAGCSWLPNPEAVDFTRATIVEHASSIFEPFRSELAGNIEFVLAEYECASELARRTEICRDLPFASLFSGDEPVPADQEIYLAARSIALGDYASIRRRYGIEVTEEQGLGRRINFKGRSKFQDGTEYDVDRSMTLPRKPHPLDVVFMLTAMRDECSVEALRDIPIELATYMGFLDELKRDRFANPEAL